MTNEDSGRNGILGSLRAVDGIGVVHVEDRFPTTVEDLWSALTESDRLVRWLGEVVGDLRLGGGAGRQVHLEDLAAYVDGRGRSDMPVRWAELLPGYRAVADESLGT